MNKKLQTLRFSLIVLILASTASVIYLAMQLWQEIQVEQYITSPSASDDVPDDASANLAKAAAFDKRGTPQ